MNKEAFIGLINTLLREAEENCTLTYENNGNGEYITCSNGKRIDITADSNKSALLDFAKGYYNLEHKAPISHERLKDIIKAVHEYDNEIIDNVISLTDEEKKALDIYTKKYKVVEVDVEMTKRTTIKVAIPEDESDVEYYINDGDLQHVFDDDDDTDFNFGGSYTERVATAEEIKHLYDECDILNYDDFEE